MHCIFILGDQKRLNDALDLKDRYHKELVARNSEVYMLRKRLRDAQLQKKQAVFCYENIKRNDKKMYFYTGLNRKTFEFIYKQAVLIISRVTKLKLVRLGLGVEKNKTINRGKIID